MSVSASDLETLATRPASASGDAGSVTSRSADDVLKLLDRAAAADALAGTTDGGAPKSALRCLRPARVEFPGANR